MMQREVQDQSASDLILMNGPPFVGVEDYFAEKLSSNYKEVVPSDIFSKDRSLGLRDVGLKIVHLIQQAKKVAVLDGNELRKVRESYIKILQKKCKDSSVQVINILPQYGCTQLFWSREHRLAENVQNSKAHIHIADLQILKWFEKETDVNICYRLGIVDAVKESEGCSIQTHVVGLSAKSTFKWEVPALLIQWELMMDFEESDRKAGKITDILHKWTEVNPCGQIIFVCDGTRIGTGEKTKQKEKSELKGTFSQLSQKFTKSVIYVYHVHDQHEAGSFVQPPKPGILAFLQRRHCLNLHSKRTVYLYETAEHMKMADNSGVRHLKGTKVMKNPSLVTSQSAATIPPIPEMLKTLTLLPNDDDKSESPVIPLYDKEAGYRDNFVCYSVGNGRTEYAFVNEWSTFHKLQERYIKLAIKVGEAGSKMSPEKSVQSTGSFAVTFDLNQSKTMSSRDLPKWMMGKQGSKSSNSSLETSLSLGSGNKDQSFRKTVYMMTDHELLETAIDILKQAGKTEIVNNFKTKLHSEGEREKSKSKDKTPLRYKHKVRNVSSMKVKRQQQQEESLSSLCPKMELESDDESSPLKQRRTITNHVGQDLSDSEESLDCQSTESSQGDNESIELDSEDEDINYPKDLVKVENEVHNQNSDKISPVKKELNDGEISKNEISNESQTLGLDSRKRSSRPRKHRTPDLSILDEIFN